MHFEDAKSITSICVLGKDRDFLFVHGHFGLDKLSEKCLAQRSWMLGHPDYLTQLISLMEVGDTYDDFFPLFCLGAVKQWRKTSALLLLTSGNIS